MILAFPLSFRVRRVLPLGALVNRQGLIASAVVVSFFLVGSLSTVGQSGAPASAADDVSLTTGFARNIGQWPDEVRFGARLSGTSIWVTDREVIVDVKGRTESVASDGTIPTATPTSSGSVSRVYLTLGSQVPSGIEAIGQRTVYHNYYLGNDPSRWTERVPVFDEVRIRDIENGLNVRLGSQGGRLRYAVERDPESAVGSVPLAVAGADGMVLQGENALRVATPSGAFAIRLESLDATAAGKTDGIVPAFRKIDDMTVEIDLSGDGASSGVVIEQEPFDRHVGGTSRDEARGIVVNGELETFITGFTDSDRFQTRSQENFNGSLAGRDAFLMGFDADGNTAFVTYFGESGSDLAYDMVLAPNGDLVVSGESDLFGSARGPANGCQDVMVVSFNPSGQIRFARRFGGDRSDYGRDIDVDDLGNIYVAGETYVGSGGCDSSGDTDAFVLKVTGDGELAYFTTYGSTSREFSEGLAVSADNRVFVGGHTLTNDPGSLIPGATNVSPDYDIYLAEVNPSTGKPFSGQLFGGNGLDILRDIDVVSDGLFAVGQLRLSGTNISPLSNVTAVNGLSGDHEGFVLQVDPNGFEPIFARYFLTPKLDALHAVQATEDGEVFVGGGGDFGTSFPDGDALLARVSYASRTRGDLIPIEGEELLFGSTVGWDEIRQLALDGAGNVYVTGYWYPESNIGSDGSDIFVRRIRYKTEPATIVVDPTSVDFGSVPVQGSLTRTIAVSNTGTGSLAIEVAGADNFAANGFVFEQGSGSAIIAPGATRDVRVQFKPGSVGTKSSSVVIGHNATNQASPITVTLTAEATPADVDIAIVPPSLDFGSIQIGASSDLSFVIQHAGGTARLMGSVSDDGDLGDFAYVEGGGAFDIGPGEEHKVVMRLTPSASGVRQETLGVAHNAQNASSPIAVTIAGTGVESANPSIDAPTTVDFGEVKVGQIDVETFSIRNAGTGSLNIDVQADDNMARNGFSIASGSGSSSLEANESVDISVNFQPGSVGAMSGTIRVTHNDDNEADPLLITVSGTGVTADVEISVSASTLDFGSVLVGARTDRSFTISHAGGVDRLTGSVFDGGDLGDFSYVSGGGLFDIGPGESLTVTMRFAPASTGDQSRSLSVSHNAQNAQNPLAVTLVGSGTQASDPPQSPTLLQPVDGAIGEPAGSTFLSWESSGDATSYKVDVATENTFADPVDTRTVEDQSTSIVPSNLLAGTTYFWRVTASNTAGSTASGTRSFTTYPDELDISRTFSFSGTQPENYRLVSFPGRLTQSLGSLLSGERQTEWRAYDDNGSSGDADNYLVELSTSSVPARGRGFWLLSTTSQQIDLTSVETVPLSEDKAFPIPLTSGEWTILGQPFDKAVSWADVEAVNPPGPLQPAWRFSGGSWNEATSLAVYEGFYFRNTSGLSSLAVPFTRDSGASKREAAPSLSAEGLHRRPAPAARLVLSDGLRRSAIGIGFHDGAEPGLDPYDVYAPPGNFEAVKLTVALGDSSAPVVSLASDYRPEPEEGATYPLRLRVPEGSSVSVSLDAAGDPSRLDFVLIDPESGLSIDLSERSSAIALRPNASGNYLLAVGNASYVSDVQSAYVPSRVEIRPAFPNPFRTATRLQFALAEKGNASISVLNLLGQRILRRNLGALSPGWHEWIWEGESEGGVPVPSGVYLIRLRAGDQVSSMRVVRVR